MPKSGLSRNEINTGLKNSTKDGIYYNAMTGITDTYTTPFALALGAGHAEIGLLNSIPKFFSTIVQIFTGKVIDKVGLIKKINDNFTLIAILVWIPIIFLPLIDISNKIILLIILLSLSQIALSIASVAWANWLADLVPERIRGRYFGRRNMLSSASAFATTLIGGWILGFFNTIQGFQVIFFLAFIFGLMSYFYLEKIPEIKYSKQEHEGHEISLQTVNFLKEYRKSRNFSNFTLYFTLLTFAVNIASPFFIVYMLENLKIGYGWYAVSAAATVLAALVMQPYWGRLADRHGDRTIMAICGILVVFYPFFFLFVRNPFDVILISIFSGFAWSGHDLTSFNYLLDTIPPFKRPVFIGNFKLLTGLAAFAGPLLGGFLAEYLKNSTFLFLTGLQLLFLLSFVLRGVSTALLLPKLSEVRVKASKVLPLKYVFWKAVAVYPTRGITHEISHAQYCISCWERKVARKLRGSIKSIV